MPRPTRRLPIFAVLFLMTAGFIGGQFGGRVRANPQAPEDSLWTFGRILSLVEDQYVGEADSSELVEHAIDGMLRALDPHSNYLSAESFSEMRDEQRGRFYGLGIQITKRGSDKPLTIIAPIDGTPASRAGLQSGDIISEIEGAPTIDLTVQDAVRLLKGDKGTRVTITIQRPGLDEPFEVTIERDEIPIQSVRVSYMVDDDVGVVRIGNFTSTTADELDESIGALSSEGMKKLILDLRGNPGGLLDQAVEVSERFIDPGKLIVYTRGRIPGSNQNFVARKNENHVDLPIVVLVDHSSASASEIVSGAIQDHDRGQVVGATTFGKGLVQRVIPLRDGGALAVTTAKYYTPAGRLIQRDYSDLDEYYLSGTEGDGTEAPEEIPVEEREIFFTASGRKVYGGGGITPDHIVPLPRESDLVLRLRRDNLIFEYAVRLVNERPDLERGFQVDEAMLQGFAAFLRERQVEFEADAFRNSAESISHRLRAQAARIKWDPVEEARIRAESDAQIQRALSILRTDAS